MGVRQLRIYLDSCVVIRLLESVTEQADAISQALTETPKTLCASGLVRAECLVGPLKSGNALMADRYRVFFGRFELFSFTEITFDLAAKIRAKHGLLLPDALHLAIAEVNACDEFWTADAHFDRIADHVGVQVRRIG